MAPDRPADPGARSSPTTTPSPPGSPPKPGDLLVDLRTEAVAAAAAGRPVDGKALGAEGDRRAHELLMAGLAAARPGDAVLSEEGVADPARLTADRVWIVDPLDGTREYGEVPREDWAVHVALVVGGVPVAGAVALPGRGPDAVHRPRPSPAAGAVGPPAGGREPQPAPGRGDA